MIKAIKKAESTIAAFNIDEKDLSILKLLQHNARITVKEISDKIHLSTTPVHERIKRMEEAGVIKQYATLVDHSKVKKGLMVICYVSLKQHNKNAGMKFIKLIQNLPEVVECYNISGEFDFMLKVMAENMDAYYDFHVNKLSMEENIGHVQSVFVMGIINKRMFLYIKLFVDRLRSFMALFVVSLTCTFRFLWQQILTSLRAKRSNQVVEYKKYLVIIRHVVLKYFFIATILILSNRSNAQDSITVDYLLDRIETQQLKQNNFFINGIFPSYINASRKFKTKKKDNTIFYNALVAYTLKESYNKFSPEQKIICDSIIARSVKASAHFKNKNRNTYNFWRTDTATKFHYSWWLPIFEGKKSLPDDMDDTVLGLLMNAENKDSAEALHQLMQSYINLKPPLKTTYKIYANDSVYSTWFGKKFPVVFDASVMCNVLSFVQQNNLQWTKADSASLQYIIKTIERNDIIKHPSFVSPYYGNTSIILYHIARLMSIKQINELESIKPQLIAIADQHLQSSDNMFERIMLSSALIKWNAKPAVLNINTKDVSDIERNDLPFFTGNIPSYFKQPWKENFISLRLLMYNHYCPAWNDCLLLEYLLLKYNDK